MYFEIDGSERQCERFLFEQAHTPHARTSNLYLDLDAAFKAFK